jgi:hypothetical protein
MMEDIGSDQEDMSKKSGIPGMKEHTLMLECRITGVGGKGTLVLVPVPLNGSDN